MTTLIRNEITKLRTVRSPWLLLAIQQAVIVAGISGLIVAGLDVQAATAPQNLLAHAAVVSSIFTLVLGITAVAGEYRHRTITDTYLATPRRARVTVAKLVAYTAAGLVYGSISALTGLIVAAVWMNAKGAALDLSEAQVWRNVVGIVAINAGYAAIGVSLGALVRNLTGAVAIALSWIAVVETIMGNLLGDLARWLPNRGGMAVADMPATVPLLTQGVAALVMVGYVVLFVGVAVSTTVRRDVT